MAKNKKFQIFCRFSAIGKKTISASSLGEALQIVADDASVEFDEIIRLPETMKIDETLSQEISPKDLQDYHDVEYKSWGTE